MKKREVCNTVIIKEVANELGLTIEQVKQIIASQSIFTRQIIESSTFDSIRWPYLGVFKSKPKEVQMINHLKGLNKEQQKEFKRGVKTGVIKLTGDENPS